MRSVLLSLVVVLALLLSACTPTRAPQLPIETATPAETSSGPSTENAPATSRLAPETMTRVDQQGAVVVTVTPTNLDQPGKTLDFQVSLETHSVDLSMDLATIASLSTDTNLVEQAISWSGAKGGHHISGTLSFPTSVDGKLLLAGAKQLTLSIKGLDAPERIFTWTLP